MTHSEEIPISASFRLLKMRKENLHILTYEKTLVVSVECLEIP